MPEKVPDSFFRAAWLALALTLAVVLAASGIRHGVDEAFLRPIHRLTATLEVPVVLWLAWRAWRTALFPPVAVALVLTAMLTVVGIVGGKNPPPGIAAANLLGGLALAAAFAWIAGKRGQDPFLRKRVLTPFLVLLAIQLGLGAWVSIRGPAVALPMHGLLAVLLVFLFAVFSRTRAILALAVAAPLAGMSALHFEYSALAPVAHTLAAAALVCTAAYAWARRA